MNAITDDATTATSTGGCPSRSDGSMNETSTSRLAASPASAPSPRHRPRSSTAPTKMHVRIHIGVPRWKS